MRKQISAQITCSQKYTSQQPITSRSSPQNKTIQSSQIHVQQWQSQCGNWNTINDKQAIRINHISHINPLNRNKFKSEHSDKQSTNQKMFYRNNNIETFNDTIYIENSLQFEKRLKQDKKQLKQKSNRWKQQKQNIERSFKENQQLKVQSKLNQVIRKLEKNQKQIQKIKKLTQKQNYTMKILQDFKQIKDVYSVIRQQKHSQQQFNKNMKSQIQLARQAINKLKQKIESNQKLYYSKKELDKKFLIIQQNKWSHQIIYQSFQKKIAQLTNQIQNTSLHLKNIEKNIIPKYNNIPIFSNLLKNPRALTLTTPQKSNSLINRFIQHSQNLNDVKFPQIQLTQNIIRKSGQICQLTKLIYYIDDKGYLLDQNKYYLLNEKDQVIKIDEQQLNKLKQICQFNMGF